MSEQHDRNLEQIARDGAFDVVVVGGGINGIGVYRELALQGLRVLLVERNDFCSACSSAPSRMIHGGLRYLENGEFNLVWEALRERDALLANAPHMVRPLPTTIPIKSVFSGILNGAIGFLGWSARPASRGALPIKIGLTLYDFITRQRRALPTHTFRNARTTYEHWPALARGLRYSATYYDAWISYPERLGVEMIADVAAMAPESVALNYAEIVAREGGFALTDKASGRTFAVSAGVVVNATGAWVDEAYPLLSGRAKLPAPFVSGTKGSHLIIDNRALHDALRGHMIFFENADGRVCIVFPYLGKVLAGATDIRVERVERVRCEPDERDYILDALRGVFPGIAISADEVVFSYSGIRPLPTSDHEFTGRISRGHDVQRLEGNVPQFCLIGGKWTTFRALAEQAADAVLAELGETRRRSTLDVPIGGGAAFSGADKVAEGLVARYRIFATRAGHLVDLYGTRASAVLEFCASRADDVALVEGSEFTAAEIAFIARNEFVESLSDVLLRRTPLAIRGEVSGALIERVATLLALELGWDEARRRREIAAFGAELSNYHGVPRETLDKRSENRSGTCV